METDIDIDIMPILYYLCYLMQVQLIYSTYKYIYIRTDNEEYFMFSLMFQYIYLNCRHPEIEEVEISAMKDMFNYAEKQGWIQK